MFFFPLAPYELGFALDGSDSLTTLQFEKVQEFVRTFVRSLTISRNAAQIGVIEYSDRAKIEVALNESSNSASLDYAILYIGQSGGRKADTVAMLRKATDELFSLEGGARPGVPRFLVVLTGGKDAPSKDLEDAVRKAKENGIRTLVVDIGDTMDVDALKVLVPIAENRYGVDDVASLSSLVFRIKKDIVRNVAERK